MKKRACDCPKCRECCTREPGWFLPEQIAPAAAFLGMSEAAFVDRFCERHASDGETASPLSPARRSPRSTACIFYRGGKCAIHPVKPHECARVFGCDAPRRNARLRELIARAWR